MIRFPRRTALALAAAAWATAAAAVPDDTLVRRLEHAHLTGDAATLAACRQELAARFEAEGPRGGLRYTLAYVEWRLAHLPGGGDADDLLESAQEALEANVEADPGDIESRALLAGILGERIGRAPIRGLVLGRRADAHLRLAVEAAPDNPRVVLQQGVAALFEPSMFGGSVEEAERRLRRAAALFARQPEEASWPNWGRIDALGWLGQALVRQGRRAEARAVYEQALALEPEAVFIRRHLLPQLDGEAASPGPRGDGSRR
jgi:tetratricopeptide (TPR) repeat protein